MRDTTTRLELARLLGATLPAAWPTKLTSLAYPRDPARQEDHNTARAPKTLATLSHPQVLNGVPQQCSGAR
jgi:hypothetical protein